MVSDEREHRNGVLKAMAESEKTSTVLQMNEALIRKVKILEEQLQHAQKMEAIGTLAGGIAHDFNNILSVIVGYGTLMRMKLKPDDPTLPYLGEILSAGERATRLIRGLLAFSRKRMLDLRTVEVNSIVANFKKTLEPIIGEDIEFRVIAAQGELLVLADAWQIEQVLMNLAANARAPCRREGR